MKGDEKYVLVCNIVIVFVVLYGIFFRDVNLIDVDFINVIFKSIDFRGFNIICIFWKNMIKLDCIWLGKIYLKDIKIRELVKIGEGENINLDCFIF